MTMFTRFWGRRDFISVVTPNSQDVLISLRAPPDIPLALPRREFTRLAALVRWESICSNRTESDAGVASHMLGCKPGLSYVTTFIYHHYPSPRAM